MASEIVVAAISGGTGLAAGVVGSLFAPWANWGVEKRRLRRASRVERVQEWRAGVASLRTAERRDGQKQRVLKSPVYEQSLNVRPEYVTVVPDPDHAIAQTKAWFRTLRPEMAKSALERIQDLSKQPLAERIGELPALLDEEINSIERDKWKLV